MAILPVGKVPYRNNWPADLAPGQTLEVFAYDLAAEIDIPAWCWTTGHVLVSQNIKVHPKRFIIKKSAV